jgi:hypothetical protein
MARLEHAAIALVLLFSFVADLRVVAPIALGVAVWWLVRHHANRFECVAGIVLLALATLEFQTGSEVAAWALTLTVAVGAGVIAARPAARERSVSAT